MENCSLFGMLFLILQIFVVSVLSSTEICPGGTSTCPDTATCCQLLDKTYGCCPLKNAVCCDDHIHCCPIGSKCEAGICLPSDGGNNVTAEKTFHVHNTDISCFGSKFSCKDNMTCCKGKEPGTYNCCPVENAVCCPDGLHCCPSNTICDEKAQLCVSKDSVSEMYDHHKNGRLMFDYIKYSPLMKSKNVNEVICPDVSYVCPDGYTCCQLPNDDWGCCPFPNATCCSDHLHCCPENNQCDATSEHCLEGNSSKPSLPKKLAKLASPPSITCPDNSTCAETMTCCQLHSMHYGCCAYENAVCCSDHEHCCPCNSICDVELKQCVPKDKWLTGVLSKYYKKLG